MIRHQVSDRRADAGAPVQAVAFALSAGAAIDAGALIHVDPLPGHGRRLLLCVEPLEPSERGLELASLALTTLRETFAAAVALPPAAALMKAFTAANAVLINENRPLAGCRWERRVYVGATGVVLSGRELIIAQVPPTETMIAQDGRLYAFPELASWRLDYVPATDEPEPEPLGCREGTRPFLFRTTAAPGDLITLCSTAIARHLGRGDEAALAPLLRGDPETTLDYLGDLAAAQELDDAHAAVIQLRRLAPQRHLPRLSLPGSRGGQATWPVITPRVPSAQRVGFLSETDRPGHPHPGRRPGCPLGDTRGTVPGSAPAAPGTPVGCGRGAYAVRTDWGAVGVPLDRPLDHSAGVDDDGAGTPAPGSWPRRIALPVTWARQTVAGFFDQRAPRPVPSRPAPSGMRRHYLAAPGVRSVHRYRDQASIPAEWRSHLPRGPEVHLPSRLFAVGLVLFLAFGGSGALLDRYRTQVAEADAALATVDGSLQAFMADPAAAPDAIAAAEAALAQARGAGADVAALQRQALAVDTARDQAWGNIRLQSLTRIGTLPPSLTGAQVQLARTGREIWLVGGGLYGVDQTQNRLVQVLGTGSVVPGGAVHALSAGVSDGGQLVVFDDTALYARDETGRWQRHLLAPEASGLSSGTTPLASYLGSLYGLGPAGELLKVPADGLSDAPEVWVSAADYPELLGGIDLVIDGRIHVLVSDGRVLTFYRGALQSVLAPEVTPALVSPQRLIGGPDTNFLYLHDPVAEIGLTTGRIVRLDGAGNAVQILPPLPNESGLTAGDDVLSRANDLVIDEEAGLVYLLTDTELWRAALPR